MLYLRAAGYEDIEKERLRRITCAAVTLSGTASVTGTGLSHTGSVIYPDYL